MPPAGAEFLPARTKLSRFCRVVRDRLRSGPPAIRLFHTLSGQVLELHARGVRLLELLRGRGPLPPAALRRVVPDEELPALRDLFLWGLLVDAATGDETELILDRYPFRRQGVLFSEEGSGALRVFTGRPSGVPGAAGRVEEILLGGWAADLFRRSDGTRTLRSMLPELASARACPEDAAREHARSALLGTLTHPDLQLVKISPVPDVSLARASPDPAYLSRFVVARAHARDVARAKRRARGRDGVVNLREYHVRDIREATRQFEQREVTVSYAFRRPSSALGGRSYGGALFDRALELGAVFPGAGVVEVGGGTGAVAREFLGRAYDRDPALARSLTYTMLDLSPVLLARQREETAAFSGQMTFLRADAEALPLGRGSADLLISNEMISDLRVLRLRKGQVLRALRRRGPPSSGSAALRLARPILESLGLDVSDAPAVFHLNWGALRFLREIVRALRPSGTAIVIEYGHLCRYPEPTDALDHDEFTIHWGHLVRAALRLGFAAVDLTDLPSFLRFNLRASMFAGEPAVLKEALRSRGVLVEAAAYTESEVRSLVGGTGVGGLHFAPLHAREHYGPSPLMFKALAVRRGP